MDVQFTLSATPICPVGQRTRIALTARDVPFTFDPVREARAGRQGAYRLAQEVPLLTVTAPGRAQVRLSDSLAITELVEDLFPDRSLHPADPLDRARHRDIAGLGLLAQYQLSYAARATEHNILDVQIHRLNDTLRRLNSRLEQGTYRGTMPISNADVILAPTLWRIRVLDRWCGSYLLAPHAELARHADRILPLGPVAAILTDRTVEDWLTTLRARGALIADRTRDDGWAASVGGKGQVVGLG